MGSIYDVCAVRDVCDFNGSNTHTHVHAFKRRRKKEENITHKYAKWHNRSSFASMGEIIKTQFKAFLMEIYFFKEDA